MPVEMNNGGSAMSGGSHINFHVHTNDADSFNASKSQIHADLGTVIQRAMARNGQAFVLDMFSLGGYPPS
jgi:hypothetical protein